MCYHKPEVIGMKFLQKLTNERFARSAAGFLKAACYFVIAFVVLCTVLGLMGRQTFTLHTNKHIVQAIAAEGGQDPLARNMTVHTGDDIHVWTNGSGQIEPAIRIGLALMYAVHTVPVIFAFWFLSRVFSNIHGGRIFTEQNASFLLYYGLLQFFGAVFVPFIKLLICSLASLASDGRITISTGQNMLSALIPGIAFLVAAYIIHYGVHLQDEVDHTL